MTEPIRTLSLFSGIGLHDLGLQWAGFEIVGQVENDWFCTQTLKKNFPKVKRWGDIRNVTVDNIRRNCGSVDCITGGFPCQDVSAAGKGAGIKEGLRSGLWREMWRIIRGIRPRWLLLENVPALRLRGVDGILTALEALGYTCWPLVVGAWAVGAPHKRDRVYIVAFGGNVDPSERDNLENAILSQLDAATGLGSESRMVAAVEGIAQLMLASNKLEHANRDESSIYIRQREPGQDATGSDSTSPGAVDDPESIGSGRGRKSIGIESQHTELAGASDVPNTNGLRLRQQPGRRSRSDRQEKIELERDSKAGQVVDAPEPGSQRASRSKVAWSTFRFPAPPGSDQYDWERPRTIESRVGSTTHGRAVRLALQAIGNANPPQTIAIIGKAIMAVDKLRA